MRSLLKRLPCPNIVIYDEYEETLIGLVLSLMNISKYKSQMGALRMIDGDDKLIISLKELMPNEKINAVNPYSKILTKYG